jgi:hypothetical protein
MVWLRRTVVVPFALKTHSPLDDPLDGCTELLLGGLGVICVLAGKVFVDAPELPDVVVSVAKAFIFTASRFKCTDSDASKSIKSTSPQG